MWVNDGINYRTIELTAAEPPGIAAVERKDVEDLFMYLNPEEVEDFKDLVGW